MPERAFRRFDFIKSLTRRILSAKIEIQNLKILPPRAIANELNQELDKYFRYFSGNNGEVIVNQVLIDFTLDSDRYFDIKGILDLPIGRAKLSALMSMGRDFNENPFFNNLKIVFTSLSPLGKSLMDDLINSGEIPLEKTGVGYTLQMAGFLNDRYTTSLHKAEVAAEDAVISSIRAGLEVYATEQLMVNGRRSWPTNPFDALSTKPFGHTTDATSADTDGEWTYNTSTNNITHQGNDNTRWHWDYSAGTQSGNNAVIGTLGERESGVGD